MPQIKTINIVEYIDACVQQVVAFPDTTEGNQEAETMFISFIETNSQNEDGTATMTPDEISACIADGIYEQGDYQVFLIHST